jgi:hypothetical protein
MSDVSFTSVGGQLVNEFGGSPYSSNPRELFEFQYQVSAINTAEGTEPWYGLPVVYKIQSGQLPNNLTLNTSTGLISGTVIDLDTWVPEYIAEGKVDIAIDGSNYASKGSARDGSYLASFTIRAYVSGYESQAYADQSCSILVINNYSSDRDQLIRDYSAKFGSSFIVNGRVVDAETYLTYQKSLGNYPPL